MKYNNPKLKKLKDALSKRKISITIIIVLLIIVGVLFVQKQNCKNTLFYQHQSIPHIELINILHETQNGMSGEIRGFVKFKNSEEQPRGLWQYYIIKPLSKFDKNLAQYFSLEEIIAMPYLSPKSLGVSELVEVNKTNRVITLEDEGGNRFFIDRISREISTKDAGGDIAELITNYSDYRDFMKLLLK